MGVEYSARAGYGFGAPTNDVSDQPRLLQQFAEVDDAWWNGDIDKWLEEQGFPGFTCHLGGDRWSGPEVWSIVLAETHSELMSHRDPRLMSFLPDVSSEDVDCVNALAQFLEFDGHVGWHVFMDVT